MCVPLYRQEQDWKRQGLFLSRQVMSEWVLAGADILLYSRMIKFSYHDAMIKVFGHNNASPSKI